MNWLKLTSYLLPLLALAACTTFPFFWRQESSPSDRSSSAEAAKSTEAQAQAQVRLQMHDIGYDGKTLTGKLLISPKKGSLRLDKRLISSVSVRARAVSDCTTGQPVEIVRVDRIPPAARDTDLLVLDQSYWYGGTVHLPLFIEHITGTGPECVDAEFSLFSFDGDFVAAFQIHGVRMIPPSADGGLPEPSPPPIDAGSR